MSEPSLAQVNDAAKAPRKRGLLEVSRGRAFLTHLALSAAIVGAVCAVIFFVWYPHPYFQATGAWNALRVLIGVDLVVGPLLTLIVFKPGKWGLKFDLCVIALVQLAALGYGVTVLYRERPYYTVFTIDRFEVLARIDVDQTQLEDPVLMAPERIGRKPFAGPLLVVATQPTDPQKMSDLLDDVLSGKPDLEGQPEFWSAYAEEAAQVTARARPLEMLKDARPSAADAIDELVADLGRDESELAFVPVQAKNRDLSMIVDAKTAMPLDVLDVDPWIRAAPSQ